MNNQDSSIVALGGVSATALAFFSDSIMKMIPWLIVALPLIALDLRFGIKAAKYRKEKIRFSTGFRRTFGKMVEYLCWIILASTLSLAFKLEWLEWGVLAVVIGNEFASIVGNYLETKGIDFSLVGLYRLIFKKGAEHIGVPVSDDEAAEIIKPKEPQPRNAKGQFEKREA